MQIKRVPSLAWSHEFSSEATQTVARAPQHGSRIEPYALLTARGSLLRDRQASLASLFDDAGGRPTLTHHQVDQRLTETARLVAELLQLAERADEGKHETASVHGMRILADACFDAILKIDAVRQELAGSLHADEARQRAHRDYALRCAQELLTGLERELARALAN